MRLPTSEWELIGDSETIDGVIAVVRGPDLQDHAARFKKPVVNVSSITFPVPFPTVTLDNLAVGRLAADHLLSQGYRYFAFHMESRVYYSRQRLLGFRGRLAESGRDCETFDTAPEASPHHNPAALRRATAEWIGRLPKPLGLFTHNDVRASVLLDICQDAGIAVPEQVGVLGQDNDGLVSELTSPTLSSIDPAADVVGYQAVSLMMKILSGADHSQLSFVPPRGVVQRQSTQAAFLDDEQLARAMSFIREHATDPISITEVLEVVALSRRSLERRFRERLGRSPGEEIRRIQMEKARWLLTQTDQSLKWIADKCGFTEFRNFATAFRGEMQMTPTDFRRRYRVR